MQRQLIILEVWGSASILFGISHQYDDIFITRLTYPIEFAIRKITQSFQPFKIILFFRKKTQNSPDGVLMSGVLQEVGR